jgi:hypothetical protein
LGITLTLFVASACEKIIGIEPKHRLVETDAGLSASTCAALRSSAIGLRIADMVPGEERVDVCVAPTGTSFTEPLFASGGSECPKGIAYGQYTVRLSVAVGTYDVKLVPYGSSCSADGPQVTGVHIDSPTDTSSTSSTTVVALGKNWTAAEAHLVATKDADSTGANIYLRFFHALAGAGSLDAGLVNPNQNPPVITPAIFAGVSFGSTAQSSQPGGLEVDAEGYMIYPVQSSDVGGLNLGAGFTDSASHEAFVSSFVTLSREHHYTLFLMGDVGQPTFPPKLWSCDETSSYGAFADCGEPRPVSIGIFHPNLTDIFTDYVDMRRAAALAAIVSPDTATTGSSAGLLCIPELYSPESRTALRDLARNAATVVFSDDLPIAPESDLTTQAGTLPQYKDVVCDGDLKEQIHALQSCFLDPQLQAKGCITTSEGDAGTSQHSFAFTGKQAIGCAAEACQAEVGALVFSGSFESHACFMCAIAHLASGESIEDMYSACSSSNGGKHHFVHGGSTGLALMIKPPLVLAPGETPQVIALPASTWNRAGLRVPVKLPNSAVIDVWCASVRAPNSEPFLPNGGPYHGDASAEPKDIEKANAAEQALQISRLVAAVNGRAANARRRAIVAALTYASPQIGDKVSGLHPENYALFENPTWHHLVAHDYVPACTFCGDNPLNSPQDNQWMEHLFGIGIQADMVTETQRTFIAKMLSLVLYSTPNESPTEVPVSQYYGIQSTVRVAQ